MAADPVVYDLPSLIPDCEWSTFLREHDRVPMLTDDRKPWAYKGWLMYYRLLLEQHPDVNKRWTYWFSLMEAGCVLNDPIPQIRFDDNVSERSEGYKLIDNWINIVDREGISWSPMRHLVDWLLWGFGLADKDPGLSEKTSEALYKAVNLGPLLVRPADYLGDWISMHKGKWNPTAFFPTPHSVVELMTQMSFHDGLKKTQTVCDPCTGTGRFLLHASNYSLRLYGCDIDPMVLDVARINGVLYAPWMVRPFPDHFFEERKPTPSGLEVRNSLLNPPAR